MRSSVDRILDANLNRAREGLRVAEEVARLLIGDPRLQAALKSVRHGITAAARELGDLPLLRSRDAAGDPGARSFTRGEKTRKNMEDLVRANLRRSQEALRVLEEMSKLKPKAAGARFKRLRFRTYSLEQALLLRLGPRSRRHASR